MKQPFDDIDAAMMADVDKRRAEEAAIAAVQDAALNEVRRKCDEERKRHPGASNA
jgi:hypothetical protein